MPGWAMPGDVVFDHDAASAAVHEIGRTRAAVAAALDAQVTPTQQAMAAWQGRTRDLSEEWLRHHQAALAGLMERLEELAVAMAEAIDDAVVEQLRRDRLQVQWWSEWWDEQQASVEAGPS